MNTDPSSSAREQELIRWLSACGQVLVAYSGGVDSTYLLDVAHHTLGARAVAVTADSPSLARADLAAAQRFCQDRGIDHRVVATRELEDPAYVANDGQRCYHCKSALLGAMRALVGVEAGGAALLVGAIADDLSDWRPGMRAAGERGARFPLADLGFTKAEIRHRSRERGLSTWDRPAQPCLSSRIPYGEPVTAEALRMIEAAEAILRWHGFDACRARHHQIGGGRGALCRIEVPASDLSRVLAVREVILDAIRSVGYQVVALDLAGLISGGGNALLTPEERHA